MKSKTYCIQIVLSYKKLTELCEFASFDDYKSNTCEG